jgi:hypothetical protein
MTPNIDRPRTYAPGHRGMVGGAIQRQLDACCYTSWSELMLNSTLRTRRRYATSYLSLNDQTKPKGTFMAEDIKASYADKAPIR